MNEDLTRLDAAELARVVHRTLRERQRTVQRHDEVLGRAIAEMHDRCGLTWAQIATRLEMDDSTAHRWAKPYLR